MNDFEHDAVSWSIGTLAPGETGSVQFTLRVLPGAAGYIYNDIKLAGDGAAPYLTSPRTPICSQSLEPLDLAKSDGLGGACITSGNDLIYAIAYGNSDNGVTVHNVVLTDNLPELVAFVSASGDGAYDSGDHSVTWSLGDLDQGAAGSQTVTVNVTAPTGSTLENTCEIGADEDVGRLVSLSTQVCGQFFPRNADHKLAIHVKPHGTSCATLPAFNECRDIVTTYAGCGDLDFIPVFFDLNEVMVAELAVTWPAEWGSCAFTVCPCDAWMGGIADPGDLVALTWTSCQRGWAIVPGIGWLNATGAGLISPVPAEPDGNIGVTNCADWANQVYDTTRVIYRAGVCGEIGDPACGPMPTEPTTWGAIKAMFK